VDAECADKQRDRRAVDPCQIGLERFKGFLDRRVTAHAGLVKKIDRLPPDQLAPAEKREGQDRLAHFLDRLNGFVRRHGAAIDGLQIHRVGRSQLPARSAAAFLTASSSEPQRKWIGTALMLLDAVAMRYLPEELTMEHLWAPWRNLYVKDSQKK